MFVLVCSYPANCLELEKGNVTVADMLITVQGLASETERYNKRLDIARELVAVVSFLHRWIVELFVRIRGRSGSR